MKVLVAVFAKDFFTAVAKTAICYLQTALLCCTLTHSL